MWWTWTSKDSLITFPIDLIMESVAAKIADGNILNTIEKLLNSGVMEEEENSNLRPKEHLKAVSSLHYLQMPL